MAWLRKDKRLPGWTSFGFSPQQIDVARVRVNASGRPEVLVCDSYKIEGSATESLAQLRKSLKLDRGRCTTLLGPADYQLLQLEAPNVPAAELKAAATWRVKDLIDYPVERAAIEVLTIPGANGGNRTAQLFAVAAPDDKIRQRAKIFQDAQVALDAIDVQELAQRNIAALLETEGRALAMVSFDATGGLLTITFAGELLLARNLDITVAQLVDAGEERRTQLLERVGLELQRSLDHFDRQSGGMVVAKLLVSALPAGVGLPEYLTSNLSVPAEALELAAALDFARVPELKSPERQAQCIKVLGAALRDIVKPANAP